MAKNELDITTLTPEQRDARLALDVERLLRFGRKHKLIKDLDILVARNTLLDLLALAAPSEAKPPKEDPETPAALLDEMVELASTILDAWRSYSDPDAQVLAESNGEPHHTITPIARRKGDEYELDLVLRDNQTSEEFPDGIYHPHPDVQHIKKENIGLIEVMGLAILPPRLQKELAEVEKFVLGRDNDIAEYHRAWAEEIKRSHPEATEGTVTGIVQDAVGKVFSRVLEDAGVYKRTPEGKAAFMKFVQTLGTKEK